MFKNNFFIGIIVALFFSCSICFAADDDMGIYTFQTVQDNVARIPAFDVYVPKGFTAKITSQWDRLDGGYPGHEILSIENSDNTVGIYYFTSESYYQFDSQSSYRNINIKTPPRQGPDYERRITLMNYMDSNTVLEVFLNNLGFTNRQLKQTLPNDDKLVQSIHDLTYQKVSESLQNNLQMLQVIGSKFQMRLNGVETNMAKKQYAVGPGMIEASTLVNAASSSTGNALSVTNTIHWEILYFTVFRANTKELFDKYKDTYETVIRNICVRPEFNYLNKRLSDMNAERVAKIGAVRSQVALDASRDMIMGDYNSSSQTMDRVRNMWSDYIKDLDEYTTEGGNKIKTSMFNETVAQKGNEFYIGRKANVPLGFDILSKSYK